MQAMCKRHPPSPVDSIPSSIPSVQEEETVAKTRRKTDPAWGYCTQYIEDGKRRSSACTVTWNLKEEESIISRSI
jgi:hypothetical protein